MGAVTRGLITAVVYLLALGVIAASMFFAVMVFAGPHAGLLPSWLEPVVLIIGWLVVLVVPAWLASRVWLRLRPAAARPPD